MEIINNKTISKQQKELYLRSVAFRIDGDIGLIESEDDRALAFNIAVTAYKSLLRQKLRYFGNYIDFSKYTSCIDIINNYLDDKLIDQITEYGHPIICVDNSLSIMENDSIIYLEEKDLLPVKYCLLALYCAMKTNNKEIKDKCIRKISQNLDNVEIYDNILDRCLCWGKDDDLVVLLDLKTWKMKSNIKIPQCCILQ